MGNVDDELIKGTDTAGFRREFDQAGEDEFEERFVIDDVEAHPGISGADNVDEVSRSAGLQWRGTVLGTEVECALKGSRNFAFP